MTDLDAAIFVIMLLVGALVALAATPAGIALVQAGLWSDAL